MNDTTADKYVSHFLPAIQGQDEATMRRTLRLLVKEVERDTRHRCSRIVEHAARDVFNLDWDQPAV